MKGTKCVKRNFFRTFVLGSAIQNDTANKSPIGAKFVCKDVHDRERNHIDSFRGTAGEDDCFRVKAIRGGGAHRNRGGAPRRGDERFGPQTRVVGTRGVAYHVFHGLQQTGDEYGNIWFTLKSVMIESTISFNVYGSSHIKL